MTDLRMRSLSRLSASGDLHAQARLLVERLRSAPPCDECGVDGFGWHRDPVRRVWQIMAETGEALRTITDEERVKCTACAGFGSVLKARVALAAYAGSEAARLVMGKCSCGCSWEHGTKTLGRDIDPHFEHQDDLSLANWLGRLDRWKARPFLAPLRAGRAASWAALDYSPCCPNHDRVDLDQFMEGCPSWDRTQSAIEAADRVLGGQEEVRDRLPASAHGMHMPEAGYHLAEALWDVQCGHRDGSSNQSLCVRFEVEQCARLRPGGEPAIRTAIQKALISWSLS